MARQPSGTMKPRDMSKRSATAPISYGDSAPPMMAMTMWDETMFVCLPSPTTPSAKMLGNMMDMKK